jgi:hypothetical protein
MAMIAITTNSSMSVNPEVRFLLKEDIDGSTFVKAGNKEDIKQEIKA